MSTDSNPESKAAPLSGTAELMLYRRIISSMRDGVWHRDLETNELWVSERWWMMLDREPKPNPFSFESFLEMVHPEDISKLKEEIGKHLRGETENFKCTFRLPDREGKWKSILSRGRLLEAGTNKCVAGTHTDVTEIRAQDERKRRQLSIYDRVFNSIPHLIVVKAPDGKFIFCNQALAEFWGVKSFLDMIGKDDATYNKNKEEVAQFLADDEKVRKSGEPYLIPKESNTDHAGRIHWLTTIKVPLKREDGETDVVVVATFIDDLIAVEDRLRKEQNVSVLARKIAHKLGTRIFALQSLLHFDRRDPNYQDLQDAFDELVEFKDDFLRLTDADRLTITQFDLFGTLHRAVKSFASHAKITLNNTDVSRVEVGSKKSGGDYLILGDEGKLSSVFTELARNSLRWKTRSPHRINVGVELTWKGNPFSGVRDSHVRVTFSDNGLGIESHFKKKIFESFISSVSQKDDENLSWSDNVGTGTGLGLAIADEVIRAHNGTIEEDGKFREGARFVITLPKRPTIVSTKRP